MPLTRTHASAPQLRHGGHASLPFRAQPPRNRLQDDQAGAGRQRGRRRGREPRRQTPRDHHPAMQPENRLRTPNPPAAGVRAARPRNRQHRATHHASPSRGRRPVVQHGSGAPGVRPGDVFSQTVFN